MAADEGKDDPAIDPKESSDMRQTTLTKLLCDIWSNSLHEMSRPSRKRMKLRLLWTNMGRSI